MLTKSSLRNEYGKGYLTAIDNYKIAWKPLSIEDFFYYQNLINTSDIIPAVIEDEIFKKCVLSKDYRKEIDTLPFGVINTVVQNIMEHSGPLSIDHFNNHLDNQRVIAQEPLHYLVTLVVRAFPAYKPEDIYAMDFDIFMLRVAQAESLLLLLGILTEPIALTDGTEAPPEKPKRQPPPELRAIWEKQQKDQEKKQQAKQEPTKKPKDPTKKPLPSTFTKPEDSPVLKAKKPAIKDLNTERLSIEQSAGSEDESGERARMVKEAMKLFGPVMQHMDFYKKK